MAKIKAGDQMLVVDWRSLMLMRLGRPASCKAGEGQQAQEREGLRAALTEVISSVLRYSKINAE